MHRWEVPKEWADTLFNYMVHGFDPGGMFTSMLANDAAMMIMRSHPSNTLQAYKAALGWINQDMPKIARGSYEAVMAWTELEADQRRLVLEEHGLIYTEQQEIMLALKHGEEREFFYFL